MKVFAISDLHLSGMVDKPMNVFGTGWEGHFEKIKADWNNRVTDDDVVLIAGDISWGMSFEEGLFDLQTLKDLKGQKVFIKGNHDYWWSSISKLRAAAPDSTFHFLQNDSVRIGSFVFCGSRGWTCPGSNDFTPHDEKLYLRESERFRLTLSDAKKKIQEGDELIALIHYPPFAPKNQNTNFTKLFEESGVKKVVFGHIHGEIYFPFRSKIGGVEYFLTSCDKLRFTLMQIS